MRIDVITIFPRLFDAFAQESMVGIAARGGKLDLRVHDLRDWADGPHKSVDDAPYGGGAGMVLKVEPFVEAVEDLKVVEGPIALLSARGKLFTHETAVRYSLGGELTLLTKEMTRPNGIAFSPDEKTLYVAQSDPGAAIWKAFPVRADGTLGEGRVFADVTNVAEQRALERAGYVREGVLRQAQARADGQHDLVSYSLLRTDLG